MLEIKNLEVSTKKSEILKDLDLKIEDNKIHVIMGPNGTGKSTLCKTIIGNRDGLKVKGTIKYNGENIIDMPINEISKKGIFMLFQSPLEIPGVTPAEMLKIALKERGIDKSVFEFSKELNAICEKLDIDKKLLHRGINERMSGGERKKMEMLQIFVLKPSLILLDELDSGLDVDSLKLLSKSLMEYKKENKCSIVIVTHHMNILDYLKPDRVHVLSNKKITAEGDIKLAESIEKNGYNGTFNVVEDN